MLFAENYQSVLVETTACQIWRVRFSETVRMSIL